MIRRGFSQPLIIIIISMMGCACLYAQTSLSPYIELGTSYNDNIHFVTSNTTQGQLLKYTVGTTLTHIFTNYFRGKLSGFADADYFIDRSINDSSYQYLSPSLQFTPNDDLELNMQFSFLHYTPSDRSNTLNRYSLRPTFYYQIRQGHALKLYFNRDYYRYQSSDDTINKNTYFVGYFYEYSRYSIHPYLNYKTMLNYTEKQAGIEWFGSIYNRHILTLDLSFINRDYSEDYGFESNKEYDLNLNYSYLITRALSLNLNVSYLYTDSSIADNDTTNLIALLSMTWSTKWPIFDQYYDKSDNSDHQFNHARQLYKQKEYKRTIRILKKIIKNEPDHLESYYLLSYSYIKVGNTQEAVPYLLFIYEQTEDPDIEYLLISLTDNSS